MKKLRNPIILLYSLTLLAVYIILYLKNLIAIAEMACINNCSNRTVLMVCMGNSGGDRCLCMYGSR